MICFNFLFWINRIIDPDSKRMLLFWGCCLLFVCCWASSDGDPGPEPQAQAQISPRPGQPGDWGEREREGSSTNLRQQTNKLEICVRADWKMRHGLYSPRQVLSLPPALTIWSQTQLSIYLPLIFSRSQSTQICGPIFGNLSRINKWILKTAAQK